MAQEFERVKGKCTGAVLNMIENDQLIATTYAGLEEVLAEELIALGADEVQGLRGELCIENSVADTGPDKNIQNF